MALSNRDCPHGGQAGQCSDCDVSELERQIKQDEALIRQLMDALAPFAYENPAREAIAAGRARLSGFGCRDTEGVGLDELLCGSNGERK